MATHIQGSAHWSEGMDRAQHEQTYHGFIQLTKVVTFVTALVLALMATFLT